MSEIHGIRPIFFNSINSKIEIVDKFSRKILKPGTIKIDGYKIEIASNDSLHSLASKINSLKNKTGVEARIIRTNNKF